MELFKRQQWCDNKSEGRNSQAMRVVFIDDDRKKLGKGTLLVEAPSRSLK